MHKYILILNGPNLNLLGRREPEIYGHTTLADIIDGLRKEFTGTEIADCQSNHEGALIDKLHEVGFDKSCAGVVFNAGAYTHTSLALADAIRSIDVPVVEVHISNVFSREAIRHQSLIAPACAGSIAGFGTDVYRLGVEALLRIEGRG